MILSAVTKRTSGGTTRLIGRVLRNDVDEIAELYFAYPDRYDAFVSERADAFVPTLLIPAMAAGEDLKIAAPVSPQLLRNLDTLQDIFHQWYPEDLKKVRVHATPREGDLRPSSQHIGSFFSLGVDSFYTLLKHQSGTDAVTHLIYLTGIEKPLEEYDHSQEDAVIERIEEVAAATGRDCIIGETNLREVFPLDWSHHYHGAGLAGVAHSLAGGLHSVLIPSTHTYRDMFPWGSSPLTDPLWSSEAMRIGHDGAEMSRAGKLANFLVHDEHAMKHLRVCTRNLGGPTNCGRCDKCVRTMLALHVTGSLSKAASFPDRLPHDFSRIINIADDNALAFVAENRALAKHIATNAGVTRALSRKLLQGRVQQLCSTSRFDQIQREIFTWYFGTGLIRQLKVFYMRPSNTWLRSWYRCVRELVTRRRPRVGPRADSH